MAKIKLTFFTRDSRNFLSCSIRAYLSDNVYF